ncbi:MAG: tRNA-dihydrouridine synthase family protein [Butyrivibrio hungatei]|nr:tRNA-dihydrouridine synthase family protein [Butyrivibrio hungatei]
MVELDSSIISHLAKIVKLLYTNAVMNFWDKFEKGFTCLAPMEGVTDIAFRQVVAKAARPDIFFTEFTNVNSYSSEKGRPNALERLKYEAEERPIVAQIWGKNPEMFFETVQAAKDLGYEALDINMGCPDRHVVATGGGSGLIRTPELAVEILRAAQKVEGITISVKTRLGYSKLDEWKTWIGTLLNEHPAALTVDLCQYFRHKKLNISLSA